MSISLEQLTQILAKAGISSSKEEEILTAAKDEITPPETNKEESTCEEDNEELTFEEACIIEEEPLCEHEIEEDEEGISGDQNYKEHHTNKSCIKHGLQVSTRLDQFHFCFFFVKSHFQYLNFHAFINFRFHFARVNVNIFLFIFHVWFHWKFHFT